MRERRRTNRPRVGFDGLILARKPPGITSRDVVNRVGQRLGRRDVGHAGTLDPFATGLLQIVVGGGTKLVPWLHERPKEYRATALLGTATDTLDRTGRVTRRRPVPLGLEERIGLAAAALVGARLQTPPMYSAVRVGGTRLHELARGGATVERPPREITVHAFEITGCELPRVSFRVVCSTGTYVRVLAEALGESLGVPAHLEALERTACGSHRVEDAADLDALDPVARAPRTAWIDLPDVLEAWPVWRVDEAEAALLANGRVPATLREALPGLVSGAADHGEDAAPVRIRAVDSAGRLLALIESAAGVPPVYLRGFRSAEGA